MALAEIRVRVPECLRDRQRSKTRDRSLDRLLQRRSTALGPRRQDARRDLCYRQGAGETGGVIKPRNHLRQAAILSRNTGPPLFSLLSNNSAKLCSLTCAVTIRRGTSSGGGDSAAP